MFPSFIFAIEGMEWIIVLVVVVVLIFGASKIPKLANSLGRASGEFTKGKRESELEAARVGAPELTNEEEGRAKLIRAAKELGISTEGKSNEQLREEIRQALIK